MFRKQKECSCDWSAVAYVKTDINLGLSEAIKRVRELADKFESEPVDETLSYRLAADRIFTALYKTDVKVDLL
jgi:hypothetical protein